MVSYDAWKPPSLPLLLRSSRHSLPALASEPAKKSALNLVQGRVGSL